MTAQACPETNELQQFLGGRLSGRKAESLELHLLNCSECLDASRQVSSDGDLIGALCWSPDFSDDEVLSDVIERAKGLRLEGDTVKVGGTVVKEESALPEEPRSSSLSRTRDQCEIEFLAPAEESDEIGRLGGYRVLKVIGSGGMGIVFQAEDPKLQRQIVLKAIRPAIIANPTAKNRFIREARATAALDHDNIVHIYQVDEDRGVPFIAMQYLRGETLGQRVKRDQQFDQRSAVRIGRQTAAGLAVAHAHGLVHRDIKLENLWLEEGTGRIKILDFGLVLSIKEDASLTQTGLVVGTPRYMAPEQARGEAVDHRCDLFSLGAVLFHLVTGRPAFQGRTLTATLLAVAEADCPTVEELCPHIHQDLASLINRLLSKHREDRPQSATEVDRVLGVIENDLRSE
ncbi:MAG: serine/threonine-protein kinase, partial [Planctomycetota bacterium]